MIAVVFALEFESAFFRARHDARLRTAIWLMGAMGRNVAIGLEERLKATRPSLIVSAGFGGGLQEGLAVGDLAIGSNYSDPGIVSKLQLESWKIGSLLTVPGILETAAEKQRLGRETGCLMADMETSHIADLCRSLAIPLLSVRCISDAVGDDIPVPSEVLINPQSGRPEPLALFRHLIANPTSIPGFNRLLRHSKLAQERLATGLEELLPQLLRIV